MRALHRVWCLGLVVVLACGIHGAPRADAAPPDPNTTYTPDEVLQLVVADLRTIKPEDAAYTRYLSLRMPTTAKAKDQLARLTTAHLHDLSSERGSFPLINPTGELPAPEKEVEKWRDRDYRGVVRVGDLLRINTLYFGATFAKQWERLGGQEPFWHGNSLIPLKEDEEGERYEEVEYGFYFDAAGNQHTEPGPGRKFRATETRRVPAKKGKVAVNKRGFFIRTEAGKKAFLEIQQRMVNPVTKTYGTDVPVVDADWFFVQTVADFARDPGYHDFLGFNDFNEWQKLAGLVIDPKVITPAFAQKVKAATANSKVLGEAVLRRIVYFDSPGGGVFITQDSNQEEAAGDPKKSPLATLDDTYRFQAIESLALKANRFILKGLFNEQGVRQDVAPDKIASDSTAPRRDQRVHTGLCGRCHKTGFQPVDDWFRNMLNRKPNFLAIKEYEDRRRIQQEYVDEHLTPHIKSAEALYAEALFRACGMTPLEYSDAVGVVWKTWWSDPVPHDLAARRLGVTKKKFIDSLTGADVVAVLKKAGKTDKEIAEAVAVATTKHDPLLSVYRIPDVDEYPLPNVTFRDTFQRAADAVQGYIRPYDIREVVKEK